MARIMVWDGGNRRTIEKSHNTKKEKPELFGFPTGQAWKSRQDTATIKQRDDEIVGRTAADRQRGHVWFASRSSKRDLIKPPGEESTLPRRAAGFSVVKIHGSQRGDKDWFALPRSTCAHVHVQLHRACQSPRSELLHCNMGAMSRRSVPIAIWGN